MAALSVSVTVAAAGVPSTADDPDGGAGGVAGSVPSTGSGVLAAVFERMAANDQEATAPNITIRGEEREATLPAPVELHDNDVVPLGELRVDSLGAAGLHHEIVEVIFHDDVAVDERVVAEALRPPTPMIVSVGTSTSSAATRNWEALARCESGGDPTIVSRSGRYHGLYQFDRRTWESVGGTGLPSEASPDEQRRRAIMLYEQRGAQPWPTCGRHL